MMRWFAAALVALVVTVGAAANCLFDAGYYLSQNPDVAASGMNPLDHYNRYGWREGRDPSARFSTSGYLAANPDIAAAGMNPLDHFLHHGIYEGRSPVLVHDLRPYMASSRHCDGNPSTPLHQGETVRCVRVDYGSLGRPFWMATVTMLGDVRGEPGAITTWSFSPIGPFVDPAQRACDPQTDLRCGDGGEAYVIRGDRILARYTQDGGKLGIVQEFSQPWVLGSRQTAPCARGWTIYNPRERGCTAVIDWPHLGPVHTLVSEHGDGNAVERIFLALGWGRLHWQAFTTGQGVPDLPERCPDVGGWNASPSNQTHLRLTDCRLTVRVVWPEWNVTGAQLWRP